MKNTKDMILKQLPDSFRSLLSSVSFDGLEEIRFRIGQPVALCYYNRTVYINRPASGFDPTKKSALETLSASFCNHSVYAYLSEIKDGFITIRGGHRVGLAGKCVEKNGQITGISNISGINLRIAREYKDCAEHLLPYLQNQYGVQNTLLLSPPQCGKTTYLRDITRLLSKDYKITVVDERSEIAGTCDGTPQFDIGPQTDVLDRFPKSSGMLLALRSLSPQIIVTDELGEDRDIDAVKKLYGAGCKLIATMHGSNPTDLPQIKKDLLSLFDLVLLMGRQEGKPSVISIKQMR